MPGRARRIKGMQLCVADRGINMSYQASWVCYLPITHLDGSSILLGRWRSHLGCLIRLQHEEKSWRVAPVVRRPISKSTCSVEGRPTPPATRFATRGRTHDRWLFHSNMCQSGKRINARHLRGIPMPASRRTSARASMAHTARTSHMGNAR